MAGQLNVAMLGGLCVSVNGKIVFQEPEKLNKPWQILYYLALHADRMVPAGELLNQLWNPGELTDPANVLKNTVYALRRDLNAAGAEESTIVFENGGYRFDQNVQVCVDLNEFLHLCEKAKNAPENERADALLAAHRAFGGFVPETLSSRIWMVAPSIQCRQMYLRISYALFEALWTAQRLEELAEAAQRTHGFEAEDETVLLWHMRALQKLGRDEELARIYGRDARAIERRQGAALSQETETIRRQATGQEDRPAQDIGVVCSDLLQSARQENPPRGAYFCNYEVFKHTYALMARMALRKRQVVGVVLVTLRDGAGHELPRNALEDGMDRLKEAILCTLRKSDVFTRYSKDEFAMLMPMDDAGNAACVCRRLDAALGALAGQRDYSLKYQSAGLALEQ